MRRLTLPLIVSACILALAGLVAGSRGTTAQQGTPGATSAHPVVGAWLLNTNPSNPHNPLSVAVFSPDGTYQESDADGSDGAGTWQATGADTAILTFVIPQQDNKGNAAGFVRIRATVTVAADGASFTAPYTLELVDASGKSSGQLGPATATGTRITAEAPGTPVGPIPPEQPSGTPGAGTPPA